MSFFRSSASKGSTKDPVSGLPSASASIKITGRRYSTDWQFTPDPVDGPIRQGERNDKVAKDAQYAPLFKVSDMYTMIKENYTAYRHALPLNSKRRYTGVCHINTGIAIDGRKFARLEVEKGSDNSFATSYHVLAVAMSKSLLKSIDGLMYVSQTWFEQDAIRAIPSVKVEVDDDEYYDVQSIAASELTVIDNEPRKGGKGGNGNDLDAD